MEVRSAACKGQAAAEGVAAAYDHTGGGKLQAVDVFVSSNGGRGGAGWGGGGRSEGSGKTLRPPPIDTEGIVTDCDNVGKRRILLSSSLLLALGRRAAWVSSLA